MNTEVKKESVETLPRMSAQIVPILDEFTEKFTLEVSVPEAPVPKRSRNNDISGLGPELSLRKNSVSKRC